MVEGVKIENVVMICLAESDGEPPVDVVMIMKKENCVGAKELLQEATRWGIGAEGVSNPVVQVSSVDGWSCGALEVQKGPKEIA